MSGLLIAAVLVAVVYLASCSYSSKATVTGYVQTSQVTKRVYPAVMGTVMSLQVEPGQAVASGQLLATLRAASDIDEQDRDKLLAGYDRQIDDANKRVATLIASQKAHDEELVARIAAAKRALRHIRRMMVFQSRKVTQLRRTREVAEPLFRKGHLSRLEWERLSGPLLDAEKQDEELAAQAGDKQDRIREMQIELHKLALDTTGQTAAVRQEISRIRQTRRSLAARGEARINATVSGVVANVFVQTGDRVSSAQPLLSITPRKAHLVARLLIPSSAVGQLRVGQRVNLRYDAFPYEQYGTYPAKIVHLSAHALRPGDSGLSLPRRQPYFEAIARIDRSWVMVRGRAEPVRPGMSLKADVNLDRHSLLTWILDPVTALGAHNR